MNPLPEDLHPRGGTVWILGAGFSRSLGGPLIEDLLAHRERAVLEGFFSKDPGTRVARLALVEDNFHARGFFQYGRKQGYWENAEQFLDIVETAAAGNNSTSHPSALLASMLKGAAVFPARELVQTLDMGAASSRWEDVQGPVHSFNSLDALTLACR